MKPDLKADIPAKPTIYDVAHAAGVSIKSVSRVLRNESKVSEETRARVREAIRALDYAPHPAARSLASSVPTVIGMLLAAPVDFQAARRGSEYRTCVQMGALAAALPLGFSLRLVPVELSAPRTATDLIALARSGAVGGYLVAPPAAENRALLDELVAAGVQISVIGTIRVPEGCAAVTPDERSAMRQLVQQMIKLGHRNFGVVRGRPGWYPTEQRLAGCVDAMTAAGLVLDERLVVGDGFDFETGRKCAKQLLGLPSRPTAIIAMTDDGAAGVLAAAHEMGLSVPDDLSVTGFDDLDLARKLWPPLTTVRHPLERMAEFATRRLIASLQPLRRDIAPLPMTLEVACEIVYRDSLAAPGTAGRKSRS